MDSRLIISLRSAPRTVPPNRFDVAIIYECVESGRRAARFGDQLALEMAAPCAYNPNFWSFRDLGTREMRNAAASTAAAADLVVLSLDGKYPLTAKMADWIEMWTWLIDGHKPAVVALFAAADADCTLIRTFLRRGTASKRLDFFARANCASAETHDGQELLTWGRGANAK